MTRCSDFATSVDLAAGTPNTGDNAGTAVPVTGTHAIIAGTFAQDGSETLTIRLEFANAATGATWHRLADAAGNALGPSSIAPGDSPFAFPVGLFSAGESTAIAAPWCRIVANISGITGAATAVTLRIAFSGEDR